ncbi:LysR family transcriptional regulator [Acidiphilium sp. AL]|uniref:winged helix-turn-helix domain-containing protein n=1 Tax=Acidiphilium sp. AL TaxID=2871704 RepID=UPI0021CB712B|nr:LysR family transcriptional regulator [Acidiphilium sp. AL]MCU4159763.1 LysR family transcriptional regulator [Acidiphilium sp. AL]
MVKVRHPETAGLRIRVVLGDGLIIGPGRADLLEGIRETGSIAAAGRRMGMSYKRAWQLAEALNATFRGPVILAVKGGVAGGGAQLTPLGDAVLDAYRNLQTASAEAGAGALAALTGAVAASGAK